jgi:hypothetical protein
MRRQEHCLRRWMFRQLLRRTRLHLHSGNSIQSLSVQTQHSQSQPRYEFGQHCQQQQHGLRDSGTGSGLPVRIFIGDEPADSVRNQLNCQTQLSGVQTKREGSQEIRLLDELPRWSSKEPLRCLVLVSERRLLRSICCHNRYIKT